MLTFIYKINLLHIDNIPKLLNWLSCAMTEFSCYMFKKIQSANKALRPFFASYFAPVILNSEIRKASGNFANYVRMKKIYVTTNYFLNSAMLEYKLIF